MKREFSWHIFEKISNIKFDQNPSIGSRVFFMWRVDKTELIVAFPNFANAPKNDRFLDHVESINISSSALFEKVKRK